MQLFVRTPSSVVIQPESFFLENPVMLFGRRFIPRYRNPSRIMAAIAFYESKQP